MGTPNPDIMAKYRQILPPHEYRALEAWLSTFYDFQLDWLLAQGDLGICNKSRQIGMSHTTGAVGVLWGAFHGELTTVISIGERESVEVLDKAKRHTKVLVALGSQMAVPVRESRDALIFSSGGRVLALPSSGGRSFTGNVFLDEFAYQEHASKVWDGAAAVTMLGGKLRVASTPNGVGNDFHNLWKAAAVDDEWYRHEVPIDVAQEQGYPADTKKCWALAKGDPRLYDQLFRCKFLDGEMQYIPSALIDACSTDDLTAPDGPYYAGLDIGENIDLTALVVVRKCGSQYIVQHIETAKRTDPDLLDAMVGRAFDRFDLRRLCVDAGGLGSMPVKSMQKRHGISKIEPLKFSLSIKEDLATSMYMAFVEQKVKIPKTKLHGCDPRHAECLREDIASLKRIITSAGHVRYDAPRTSQGHADRAWAFMMALHAAMTAPTYARM